MKDVSIHVKEKCSKCDQAFECLQTEEYWCFDYDLSDATLRKLRNAYERCLCPGCLDQIAREEHPSVSPSSKVESPPA